jgi:hypothetical protein
MATRHFRVEVQPDHLEKNTKARPVPALAELIWNALDADANRVVVTLDHNELGTLIRVVVRDNGLGLSSADAEKIFAKLGGSWKRHKTTTPSGRALHGEEGKGRFKAFSIGRFADWTVTYEREGALWTYSVAMATDDIEDVQITDEVPAEKGSETGIRLVIEEPLKSFRGLDSDAGIAELTEIFALYLSDYSGITITVAGRRIDPSKAIKERTTMTLDPIVVDNRRHHLDLEIVEWNSISHRGLYLSTEKRFPLKRVSRRFQVGHYQFTAYLQSTYFSEALKAGTIDMAEMDGPVIVALDDAQKTIRNHFRDVAAREAKTYVDAWKSTDIYPYKGEASSQIEEVERQVFDIVALNVATHLPEFAQSPVKNQQFQLRMLRQAIERGPEDLQLILTEVLNLPQRQRTEMAELLGGNVSLSAIIGAAKVVTDRLKFLTALEAILFEEGPKARLKERTQLHRIIAENCWIFGDEFSLSADDQGLTQVLKAHRKHLKEDVVIDEPVKHISQKRGIVDLMLSKTTYGYRVEDITHLVVELKRPSVEIGQAEIGRIKGYAFSVADDDRFKATNVRWVYWVLSDGYNSFAEHEMDEHVPGRIHHKGNVSIFVKTWAQIIADNRARLHFMAQHLEYQADRDASLKHLRQRHAEYLSGDVLVSDESDLEDKLVGMEAE